MKKPKASDRTIDIFTGQTNVEAAEDVPEDVSHGDPSIEANADRWRDKAFEVQEHLSKYFNTNEPGESFRLTERGDLMLLEVFGSTSGKTYSKWTGVMFHRDSLYELTSVLVKASKARKEKENGKG